MTPPSAEARIAKAGFYTMPAVEYHADPVIEPSLSRSIAEKLLDACPAKAFVAHPRLSPWPAKRETANPTRDWGSVVHKLGLGAGPEIAVIHAESWSKKVDQEARRAAYDAGEVPILAGDYEEAKIAAKILREHLCEIVGAKFDAEMVLVWREGRAWCRTMLDALSADRLITVDVKTTGISCNPNADLMRHMDSQGYDFQAAFHSRALDALHPEGRGRRKFKQLWQENEPPYLTSCTDVPEAVLHMMRRQVVASINIWTRCMDTGEWPGYPRAPVRFEKPAYSEAALLAREMADPELYEEMAR
jgi:hypothetical protein